MLPVSKFEEIETKVIHYTFPLGYFVAICDDHEENVFDYIFTEDEDVNDYFSVIFGKTTMSNWGFSDGDLIFVRKSDGEIHFTGQTIVKQAEDLTFIEINEKNKGEIYALCN